MTNRYLSQPVVLAAFIIVAVLFGIVLSAITTTASPKAMAQETSGTSGGIFPIDSKPFGNTYGEWSAKWWQWAVLTPTDKSPLKDNTGINCAQAQSGPVWFLAGTFGGAAERTCTIPSGKAIMFPIYNAECSYVEYPQYKTESELRKCAIEQANKVTNLDVNVDGTKIQNLKQKYRFQSPLFDLALPNNNVFGLSAGQTKSVGDGFWIILKPLSPGKHEIHFSGSTVDFTSSGVQNFATEATYHLTVSK